MPARSKGLTCRMTLRHSRFEGAILATVMQAHAEVGIKISKNDAVRILIRRGTAPLPADEPTARTAIERHIRDCDYCTKTAIKCPDGRAFHDAYVRVHQSATPPPAPPTPQAPAQRPALVGIPRKAG